jgi:spore coat polysaccharide biosynthesis protein SpsF
MDGTIAVIEARAGEVCRRKLERRLGGKSLLEWVVRRLGESARLDQVVVALDDEFDAGRIADLVPRGVPVFRHRGDWLARYAALAQAHPCQALVRVAAVHPLIDATLIDRLIAAADAHPSCDYISYRSGQSRAVILSALGMFAEWCRVSALLRADQQAAHAADRQQATRYLYAHPEHFSTRLLTAPAPLDRADLRLTVEHDEDWDHLETIFEALGFDRLDWQQITDFLDHQPRMRARMADLNLRHLGAA